MRFNGLAGYSAAETAITGYDFEENYILRRRAAQDEKDDALQIVEEAKNANTNTALDMMDRHNEMVKKSMELFKIKEKKLAVERQNQERREEQTDLLAQIALRNAERTDLLQINRLRGNSNT